MHNCSLPRWLCPWLHWYLRHPIKAARYSRHSNLGSRKRRGGGKPMTNTNREEWPTPYSLQDVIERAEAQRATVLAIPRLELAKVAEAWAADRLEIDRLRGELGRSRIHDEQCSIREREIARLRDGIKVMQTNLGIAAYDDHGISIPTLKRYEATLGRLLESQSPTQAPLQEGA